MEDVATEFARLHAEIQEWIELYCLANHRAANLALRLRMLEQQGMKKEQHHAPPTSGSNSD